MSAAADARPDQPSGVSDPALGRLAIGMLALVFAVIAGLTPAQNDTFWQLRVGGDIWGTGEWPRLDRYSHTAAGAPWGNHEWLSQVAMFLMWRAGGMPGLEIGAAVLILATIAITYRLMVGSRLTRFVIMGAGISLSSCVWVLRPQLVTLLGVAVLLALIVRERYRFIPALFLVWANAHGGVAFGGVILAAAALAAFGRWWRTRAAASAQSHDDRRRLVTMAVVLTASGAATTLTPLGVGIFHFVLESGTRFSRHITEWSPPVPGDGLGTLFWLVALGFIAALIARRRTLLALAWPDLVSVAVALALFPLAARSLRNMGPFLIVATVATSRVLGSEFRFRLPAHWRRPASAQPAPAPAPASPSGRPLPVNAILAVLAVAGAVAVAVAWKRELPVLNWRPIDDGALAAVRACRGPLYNRYDEGGYLIWFAPEKPVFVDGRQDPYPLPFLADVVALENGGPHRALFDRWRIGCAFLPEDAPLAVQLRAEGWGASFADARWTVLERSEPR